MQTRLFAALTGPLLAVAIQVVSTARVVADEYSIDAGYVSNVEGQVFDGAVVYVGTKSGIGTGVWSTEGSTPSLLAVIDPSGAPNDPSIHARETVTYDGTLYFAAYDSAHGCELWETDGTVTGTNLHADINPGPDGSLGSSSFFCNLEEAAVLASGFVFRADDGVNGREPYFCDAAGACTLLRDIHAGGNDSDPVHFASLSPTRVSFEATDGIHGRELWTTDGSTAGTALACDINPGLGHGEAHTGNAEGEPALLGGALYFAANDGSTGCELWRYEPLSETCSLVKDVWPGGSSGMTQGNGLGECRADFAVVGEILFFNADDGVTGIELWKSDGTQSGTRLVEDIHPTGDAFHIDVFGSPLSCIEGEGMPTLTELGGELFFFANDGVHGCEPWRSDGSPSGTALIADIAPGAGSWAFHETVALRVGGPAPSLLLSSYTSPSQLVRCWIAGCELDVLAEPAVSVLPVPLRDLDGIAIAAADYGAGTNELIAIPLPEPHAALAVAAGSLLLCCLAHLRRHRVIRDRR